MTPMTEHVWQRMGWRQRRDYLAALTRERDRLQAALTQIEATAQDALTARGIRAAAGDSDTAAARADAAGVAAELSRARELLDALPADPDAYAHLADLTDAMRGASR